MRIAEPRRMTAAEFLDLPERKHIERWLINGGVRSRQTYYADPGHASCLTQLCFILGGWQRRVAFAGHVLAGDVGFRLRRTPDTVLNADIAVAPASPPLFHHRFHSLIDIPPLLAVEINSTLDHVGDIETKIGEYLKAKVPLIWIVNPTLKTIAVYRPDAEPQLFTLSSEMTAEPHLPGLRFKVADVFAKMPAVQDEAPQG